MMNLEALPKPATTLKTCTKCGRPKSLKRFAIKSRTGQPEARCKVCRAKILKAWRLRNLDKVRARARELNTTDKYREKTRARVSRWKKRHPEVNRNATRAAQSAQRREEESARRQRWLDACAIVEQLVKDKFTDPADQEAIALFTEAIAPVKKIASSKHSDIRLVMKAVRSGSWCVSEIVEETFLTKEMVRKILAELKSQGKVRQLGKLYQPTTS